MNLSQYDDVTNKLDKEKTWINVASKKVFSREFIYKPYVAIRKRYNPEESNYEYYFIFCDKQPSGSYVNVYRDDFGRIKFPVNSIWKELCQFSNNTKKDYNIPIKYLESDDDSDTYQVMI